jgi:hypothetical protein
MQLIRPKIQANFMASPQRLDARIVFTRANPANGRATYFNEYGNMVEARADQPRFEHTLGTGVRRGLLIEGARTNIIFNPRHEGTGGTALTTGNLPNAQALTGTIPAGISVARQADQVRNGMNGAVYRVTGSASTSSPLIINFVTPFQTISPNTYYNTSGYFALVRNVVSPSLIALQTGVASGGAAVSSVQILSALTTAPQRFSGLFLADPTAATGYSRIRISFLIGVSVDFDLWVGPVQFETSIHASSQILNTPGTTNAACVRNSDITVGLISDYGVTNLNTEGAVIVEAEAFDTGIETDLSSSAFISLHNDAAQDRITLSGTFFPFGDPPGVQKTFSSYNIGITGVPGGVGTGLDNQPLTSDEFNTALSWRGREVTFASKGKTVSRDLNTLSGGPYNIPSVAKFGFLRNHDGSFNPHMVLKNIRIYDVSLPLTTLITATSKQV